MNHNAVLQLLNLYFSLECEGIESDQVLESSCDEKLFNMPSFEESVTRESATGVKDLRDSVKKIRNGRPCLPSTCIYNIYPGSRRFSSAALSTQHALIACGFEESSLHIWDISSEGLLSQSYTSYSTGLNEYSACESQGTALYGHSGPVYGMSFTPQGELLLSCSADTTVRAWRMKDFKNVAVYHGHFYPVWDIDVSPFALYFATASKDHTARLWMTERMYPLLTFAGHDSDVDCVKFHPNCNYIATGSSDETVRLWNVQDGRVVRLFVGHSGAINSLAFSPNGHYIASAGEDQTIKIWDIGSGSLVKDLRGHTNMICSLCFSVDGSLLASSDIKHSIHLWDTLKDVECSSLLENTATQTKTECSPELLSSFHAKSSVQLLSFGWRNLLMAVGVVETAENAVS